MKGIKNHNQTNRLIKWTVIALDFVALWLLLPVVTDFIPDAEECTDDKHRLFWGICTLSMVLAEYWFYSTIHQRMVGAGDILLSDIFLAPTVLLLPFIAIIIKRQSPGPVFFRQRRTGLDLRIIWMTVKLMFKRDQQAC